MSVDPSDDCTFWYANEYYSSTANGNSGNWQTQIGSFRFCDNTALVKKESGPSYCSGIGAAYATITGDDVLDVQDITFYEDLTLSKGFQVTINGGYDSSFSPVPGLSALHGSLTITAGSVVISGLVLQ